MQNYDVHLEINYVFQVLVCNYLRYMNANHACKSKYNYVLYIIRNKRLIVSVLHKLLIVQQCF